MKVLIKKSIKITFLVVLLISLFVLMIGLLCCYRFIEAILKEYQDCKKVIKKHFNKNLILSEKEGKQF